jgi:hypothetical protein
MFVILYLIKCSALKRMFQVDIVNFNEVSVFYCVLIILE